MDIKSKLKRAGFSLMELTLAVLIVAILIVITVPIINRQLEKSEEYSYYLAYRTVEKLAGQIVALGDPEAESFAMNQPKNSFKDTFIAKINSSKDKLAGVFNSYKEKLANSEIFVFSKLFPKTVAEQIEFMSWHADNFDELWLGYYVCNYAQSHGGTKDVPIKINDSTYQFKQFINEESNIQSGVQTKKRIVTKNGVQEEEEYTVPVYYSVSDFDCCSGYTQSNAVCRVKNENGYIHAESGETETITVDGEKYVRKYFNKRVNQAIREMLFMDDSTCPISDSQLTTMATYFKNIGYEERDVVEEGETVRRNVLKTTAKSFCNSTTFKSKCVGATVAFKEINDVYTANDGKDKEGDDEDEGDDGPEDVTDKAPHSYTTGSCSVSKDVSSSEYEAYNSSLDVERPKYGYNWCDNYRDSAGNKVFYGMYNAACSSSTDTDCGSVDCQPKSGYVLAANNEKFAGDPCPAGETLYSAFNSLTNKYTRVCTPYDFNESTQKPCGIHSVYTGSTCECISGWTKNATGECTVLGECPKGTTKSSDGNSCVANPPIIDASRFCELIKENWNVSGSTYCNKSYFKNGVYENVYKAALGTDTNKTYLSIQSKKGAFKSLTPNVVLSNGLRLWILGDKAASIPGFSYFPSEAATPVAKDQNMCVKVPVTTHNESTCISTAGTVSYGGKSYNKGYFCSNDKNCFKLTDSSYPTTTRTTQLLDARGCCAAADYTDFHESAKASGLDEHIYMQDPTVYSIGGFTVFVDINGTKGDGTLWDDVFPFFISSNGTVYPAYPLNAEKTEFKSDGVTEASNALYLGGNSEKQLPTDVYYYEASSTGEAREKKIAFAGVSYARAVCSARKVSKYTPYCLNLGNKYKGKGIFPKSGGGFETVDLPDDYISKGKSAVKDKDSHNPCDYYVCYVAVKNKTRFF